MPFQSERAIPAPVRLASHTEAKLGSELGTDCHLHSMPSAKSRQTRCLDLHVMNMLHTLFKFAGHMLHILFRSARHKHASHFVQVCTSQTNFTFCSGLHVTNMLHILFRSARHKHASHFVYICTSQTCFTFCLDLHVTNMLHILHQMEPTEHSGLAL